MAHDCRRHGRSRSRRRRSCSIRQFRRSPIVRRCDTRCRSSIRTQRRGTRRHRSGTPTRTPGRACGGSKTIGVMTRLRPPCQSRLFGTRTGSRIAESGRNGGEFGVRGSCSRTADGPGSRYDELGWTTRRLSEQSQRHVRPRAHARPCSSRCVAGCSRLRARRIPSIAMRSSASSAPVAWASCTPRSIRGSIARSRSSCCARER